MSGGEIEGGWTPGPWVVAWGESADPDRILVRAEDGTEVCEVHFTLDQRGAHTANACLIASIPELVRALAEAADNFALLASQNPLPSNSPDKSHENYLRTVLLGLGKRGEEQARAALNKALGK